MKELKYSDQYYGLYKKLLNHSRKFVLFWKLRSHKEHATDHFEGGTMMEVHHKLPGNKGHAWHAETIYIDYISFKTIRKDKVGKVSFSLLFSWFFGKE